MRRVASTSLVLLGGLLFMGCPGAVYLSHVIPDPQRPVMVVDSKVKGLTHVQDRCSVKVVTENWVGEGPAIMDPEADEPQVIHTTVKVWKKNPHAHPTDQANTGEIRFLFIFNGGDVYSNRPVREEIPDWNPLDLAKGPPAPKPTPRPTAQPSPQPTQRTTHVLGETLSTNPDKPSPVSMPNNRGKLTCAVSRGGGPQYARLGAGAGWYRIRIKVTSHQKPGGSPTWWSLDLLDNQGESLDPPKQELNFIDPGASDEKSVEWKLGENARLLKINSGSEAGDTMEISLERFER